MIKPEDEYYMRYILLLLRGGTLLLRAILEHALQQKGIDLNQFLKSIESEIQYSSNLNKKQKCILYPTTGAALIKDFDITILAHLIDRHLRREVARNVFKYVEQLRDLRNKYVHATETKMDTFTFNLEWSNLVIIIQNGSTCISDEVTEEIKKIIDNINLKNLAMTEKILEEIKILLRKEDFTEHIQRKFADIENKLAEQIRNVQTTATLTLKGKMLTDYIKELDCVLRTRMPLLLQQHL